MELKLAARASHVVLLYEACLNLSPVRRFSSIEGESLHTGRQLVGSCATAVLARALKGAVAPAVGSFDPLRLLPSRKSLPKPLLLEVLPLFGADLALSSGACGASIPWEAT